MNLLQVAIFQVFADKRQNFHGISPQMSEILCKFAVAFFNETGVRDISAPPGKPMAALSISHLGLRKEAPYGLGVALSGGGARGFAHAGALMALEHAGLIPDIIAGVSAGSVAATMYASGMRPLEILKAFQGETFGSLTAITATKGGLFKLDRFMGFLRKTIKQRNIEELNIPTLVCATDFDHGVPVTFTKGRLDERVAASCCIPLVFQPIKINGTRYVDGGLLHNLPAWALRSKCRYMIGINVSPIVESDTHDSFLATALRTYKLVAHSNAEADMKLCDLCIETKEIAGMNVFDLDNMEATVKAGYDATIEVLKNASFHSLGPGDRAPRF